MLKNRFINKMAELNGLTALAEFKLTGDTAMISGKGDAGPVAKAIKAFSTETKGVLSAKGGYFDGEILDAQQVVAIADLPARTRSVLSCLVSSWLSRPASSAC